MTGEQKQRIRALRKRGLGYAEIADALCLSKNTVKTYCWRNLSKNDASEDAGNKEDKDICKHCGKMLAGLSKTKPRKFCSDTCRMAWWNANRDKLARKTAHISVCAHCGRTFDARGNAARKYCSHACYIAERFGEPNKAVAGA